MPENKKVSKIRRIKALDLFCGAGGSSLGARAAGADIVAGVDLSKMAGESYKANFPKAKFIGERLEDISPGELKKRIGSINLLLASPECTNHTCAKGKKRRSEKSKATAFQVPRFAKTFKPRWIVVENVVQMRNWSKYDEWLEQIKSLGYKYQEMVLDASKFGVPQSRKRLFIVFDKKKVPSEIRPHGGIKEKRIKPLLNMNGKYDYSILRTKDRAEGTLKRANNAIGALKAHTPFLLVYYGSDGAGGWQGLNRPLRTITTVDRFALVKWDKGYKMRMLQVDELKKAMGFPVRFKLMAKNRRDRIAVLGNAVCPPVMETIVKRLIKDR